MEERGQVLQAFLFQTSQEPSEVEEEDVDLDQVDPLQDEEEAEDLFIPIIQTKTQTVTTQTQETKRETKESASSRVDGYALAMDKLVTLLENPRNKFIRFDDEQEHFVYSKTKTSEVTMKGLNPALKKVFFPKYKYVP